MKADKQNINRLLKTARGQIDGILRMIEDDRYCIDVSNQILAVISILKKTNQEIICAHMKNCVKDAFENGNSQEKIEEVLKIVEKMTK